MFFFFFGGGEGVRHTFYNAYNFDFKKHFGKRFTSLLLDDELNKTFVHYVF